MPIDLARRLIAAGAVQPGEVEAALFLSVVRGVPFARALLDRGAITERALEEELERVGGLALRQVVAAPELVARLPKAMCRRLAAIPTRVDPSTGAIDVAASDPVDLSVGAEFSFHLGAPVHLLRAPIGAIEDAIRRLELDEPEPPKEKPRVRRKTPAFPHGAPTSTVPPPPSPPPPRGDEAGRSRRKTPLGFRASTMPPPSAGMSEQGGVRPRRKTPAFPHGAPLTPAAPAPEARPPEPRRARRATPPFPHGAPPPPSPPPPALEEEAIPLVRRTVTLHPGEDAVVEIDDEDVVLPLRHSKLPRVPASPPPAGRQAAHAAPAEAAPVSNGAGLHEAPRPDDLPEARPRHDLAEAASDDDLHADSPAPAVEEDEGDEPPSRAPPPASDDPEWLPSPAVPPTWASVPPPAPAPAVAALPLALGEDDEVAPRPRRRLPPLPSATELASSEAMLARAVPPPLPVFDRVAPGSPAARLTPPPLPAAERPARPFERASRPTPPAGTAIDRTARGARGLAGERSWTPDPSAVSPRNPVVRTARVEPPSVSFPSEPPPPGLDLRYPIGLAAAGRSLLGAIPPAPAAPTMGARPFVPPEGLVPAEALDAPEAFAPPEAPASPDLPPADEPAAPLAPRRGRPRLVAEFPPHPDHQSLAGAFSGALADEPTPDPTPADDEPASSEDPLRLGAIDAAPVLRSLELSTSRDEVVRHALRGMRLVARRVAVFAVKKDGFHGWACNVEFGDQDALREAMVPVELPSVLATAAASSIYLGPIPATPAHAPLLAVMERGSLDVAAVAVRVHGRAAMVLLADELVDAMIGTRHLDELAHAAGAALARLLSGR